MASENCSSMKRTRSPSPASSSKRQRTQETDGPTVKLNEYEEARRAQIARNNDKLAELGLLDALKSVAPVMPSERKKPRRRRQPVMIAPASRRSRRVACMDAVSYATPAADVEELTKASQEAAEHLRESLEMHSHIPCVHGALEDVLVMAHPYFKVMLEAVRALPAFQREMMVLSDDGVDDEEDTAMHAEHTLLRLCRRTPSRLEDRLPGPDKRQLCHWHRHKTFDKKTKCARCCEVHTDDQLCGPCLWNRYKINILDALHDPHWVGPYCRDQCNCSTPGCGMRARGCPPTRQLAKTAAAAGKTINEYLEDAHCERKLFGMFMMEYQRDAEGGYIQRARFPDGECVEVARRTFNGKSSTGGLALSHYITAAAHQSTVITHQSTDTAHQSTDAAQSTDTAHQSTDTAHQSTGTAHQSSDIKHQSTDNAEEGTAAR